MFSREQCRQEIVHLHEFFVGWYTGTTERDTFNDFEEALGEDFQLISPEGRILSRTDVVEMVNANREQYEVGEFDIEIRNVEVVDSGGERTLCRYEEHQRGPDGADSRLSTVLFAPGVERDGSQERPPLEWRYLQETWLDRSGES